MKAKGHSYSLSVSLASVSHRFALSCKIIVHYCAPRLSLFLLLASIAQKSSVFHPVLVFFIRWSPPTPRPSPSHPDPRVFKL